MKLVRIVRNSRINDMMTRGEGGKSNLLSRYLFSGLFRLGIGSMLIGQVMDTNRNNKTGIIIICTSIPSSEPGRDIILFWLPSA